MKKHIFHSYKRGKLFDFTEEYDKIKYLVTSNFNNLAWRLKYLQKSNDLCKILEQPKV